MRSQSKFQQHFSQSSKDDAKIHMEVQETPNGQSNPEE